MIVSCPRCSEHSLTYRYDEVYCVTCGYYPPEDMVPPELDNYMNQSRIAYNKMNREWDKQRRRAKKTLKARIGRYQ